MPLALGEGRPDVPAPDRGRVGVCSEGRDEDTVVDGLRPPGPGLGREHRRRRAPLEGAEGEVGGGRERRLRVPRRWGRSGPTPSSSPTCTATSGSGASTGTRRTPTRDHPPKTRGVQPPAASAPSGAGAGEDDARQNRSAQRIHLKPTFRYSLLSGFRVVRPLS